MTRDNYFITRGIPVIGKEQLRFSRSEDYIERFDELVSTAVANSIRDPIGLMLSGGLDSGPAAWWVRRRLFTGGEDWPRFADRRRIEAIL